jgi:hypothetical protein
MYGATVAKLTFFTEEFSAHQKKMLQNAERTRLDKTFSPDERICSYKTHLDSKQQRTHFLSFFSAPGRESNRSQS